MISTASPLAPVRPVGRANQQSTGRKGKKPLLASDTKAIPTDAASLPPRMSFRDFLAATGATRLPVVPLGAAVPNDSLLAPIPPPLPSLCEYVVFTAATAASVVDRATAVQMLSSVIPTNADVASLNMTVTPAMYAKARSLRHEATKTAALGALNREERDSRHLIWREGLHRLRVLSYIGHRGAYRLFCEDVRRAFVDAYLSDRAMLLAEEDRTRETAQLSSELQRECWLERSGVRGKHSEGLQEMLVEHQAFLRVYGATTLVQRVARGFCCGRRREMRVAQLIIKEMHKRERVQLEESTVLSLIAQQWVLLRSRSLRRSTLNLASYNPARSNVIISPTGVNSSNNFEIPSEQNGETAHTELSMVVSPLVATSTKKVREQNLG